MSAFTHSAKPASLMAELAALSRDFGRRGTRVIWLTLAIVLLSLADLYITLLYLRTVGMGEANPVARFVMVHGTPTALILWKLGSVALASIILIATRRARSAEIGAWICCATLVWLTLQWTAYSREVTKLTPVLHKVSQSETAKWVHAPARLD